MRRIAERTSGPSSDRTLRHSNKPILGADAESVHISVSVQLASEYVRLGRLRRATKLFHQISPIIKQGQTSLDTGVAFFLRFAEASYMSEEFEQWWVLHVELGTAD